MWRSLPLLVVLVEINVLVASSDSSPLESPDDTQGLPLNLSPYELHVINDLLFELPALKCSSIDRVTAQATKKFIEEKIIEVDRDEESSFMHPEFFPVYQTLVRCMEYLQTERSSNRLLKPKESRKKEQVDFSGDQEKVAALRQQFNEQVMLQRLRPQESSKKQSSAKSFQTLSSVWDWISNIIYHGKIGFFKSKEEIEDEKRIARKKELKKKEEVALGDFHMLMAMLSRILMNSCPVKHKPDHSFITKAIQEVFSAMNANRKSVALATEFFFVKHQLWNQVRRCTIGTEKPSKSTNAVDSENKI